MKTVFLRALEANDKAAALLTAIREPEATAGRQRFEMEATSFAVVPRSPFAYWLSDSLRRVFTRLGRLGSDTRTVHKGVATSDDFRFLRATWEADSASRDKSRWFMFAKGGVFSRYYADVHLVVNWENNAHELETFILGKYTYLGDNANWLLHRETPYMRPGITWTYATTLPFSARALPAGCIFGHGGPAAFGDLNGLPAMLSIVNSAIFGFLINLGVGLAAAGRKNYDIGIIDRTPFPCLAPADRDALATLGRRAWSLNRWLDTHTETSHAFTLPALSQVEGDTLASGANAWAEQGRITEAELASIQTEIDERCFDLYGIDEADRRVITEGFGGRAGEPDDAAVEAEADSDDENEAAITAGAAALAAELVSWTVGVAFGRFDVRLATGARALPTEPEPFDPLPVCSPAMLTGDDGLPLASAPAGYPLAFHENGILVDDPGDPRDLTAAVRAVFEVVFGARADAIWEEAAALLDPKGQDLRAWLASGFFEHHLKRYSKSRRKAPILWQLGAPSGRYSVWLYAHRLTGDSFFQIQNDVVTPKLAHEERRLTSLVQSAGDSPSAKERKETAAQEAFVEELRGLLEETKRVAPLWSPTLDDGVVLTMAPLYALVPQHKPWQRELKSKWDALVAGKYDWAHIAMHLWPERVVPKCAADRSLAIAHGLEEMFWAEGDDGKWEARSDPMRPVEELVGERSSMAVGAALQAALDQPDLKAIGTRRARAAQASPS